jgi:hypothetical protein
LSKTPLPGQNSVSIPSWALRYPRPRSRDARNAMQALALHEITHYKGFHSHDELFAAQLTRNMELFLDFSARKASR